MDNVSPIDKLGNLYVKLLCNNINIDISMVVMGYLTSECQICSDKYMPENMFVHDPNKCTNNKCFTYSLITKRYNFGKVIAVKFEHTICKYCAILYGSSVLTCCTMEVYEHGDCTWGIFEQNILQPEKIKKKRKKKKWFRKFIISICVFAVALS